MRHFAVPIKLANTPLSPIFNLSIYSHKEYSQKNVVLIKQKITHF